MGFTNISASIPRTDEARALLYQRVMSNPVISAFVKNNRVTDEAIDRSMPAFLEYIQKPKEDFSYRPSLRMYLGTAIVVWQEGKEGYTPAVDTREYLKYHSSYADSKMLLHSFSNFNAKGYRESDALKFSLGLSRYYALAGNNDPSFLIGSEKNGKSHLAFAILNKLAAGGMKCSFEDLTFAYLSGKTEMDLTNEIEDSEAVVFSHFGEERAASKLYNSTIRGALYRQKKVIFTSKLQTNRIEKILYGEKAVKEDVREIKEFSFIGLRPYNLNEKSIG